MGFLFVLIVGLIAGTISGIVGTGSSIMLMPVLVYEYGPKQAVPIMAVAAVLANLSRILAWWREVDWRACAAYSVTGIPAAALGARTLLALPSHAVDIAIGMFLIAMVPVRHWLARHELKANLWHLAHRRRCHRLSHRHRGLDRAAERAAVPVLRPHQGRVPRDGSRELARALFQQIRDLRALRRADHRTSLVKGLIAGSSLMFGAFIAKRFVLHLKPDAFRLIMDGIMLAAGASMLWTALTA